MNSSSSLLTMIFAGNTLRIVTLAIIQEKRQYYAIEEHYLKEQLGIERKKKKMMIQTSSSILR